MMQRKKVNNQLYRTTINIGASLPIRVLWYFTNILFFKNSLVAISGLKVLLLRLFGARIGNGVVIKPGVNIKYPWKLIVGNHCWIGESVWIDNLSQVALSDSVTISQGAMLLTGSHDHTSERFDFISNPIFLEDGAWIGAQAVVFGGVTVKNHSILGIASVAEKDLEPYIIYKGNPAVPVIERIIN
jgi:putative colanic acid biosynthesis acetyltransferase WcaF